VQAFSYPSRVTKFDPVPGFLLLLDKMDPDLLPAMTPYRPLSLFSRSLIGVKNLEFHPGLTFSLSRSGLKFQMDLRSA